MSKLVLSIIFSLIPLIFWFIQYFLSKKMGILANFKAHFTCYYVDWIFIPINLLFLYSIKINNAFYYLLLISIIFNIALHVFWGKIINQTNSHLFSKKTKKINLMGIFHLIFQILEFCIIISILFFTPISSLILLELFFVLIYSLGILVASYKKYKGFHKVNILDFLGGVFITLIVVIKFIYFLQIVPRGTI